MCAIVKIKCNERMQAMEDVYERLKKLNMMREILKSIVCEDKNRPKNLDKED